MSAGRIQIYLWHSEGGMKKKDDNVDLRTWILKNVFLSNETAFEIITYIVFESKADEN